MNWRFKAVMQTLLDKLPDNLSYPIYYKIQRSFGALKHMSPMAHFQRSVLILDKIKELNYRFSGKTFLEIGTGATINVPIGLWLCGASRIITVDLNSYLREELVLESVQCIRHHRDVIMGLFADYSKTPGFSDRLNTLISASANLPALLELMNIEYLAPADASSLEIADASVDFHFSTAVFEHIPPQIIRAILSEARRVLRKDGLLIHRIDLSDHFSHSDRSITSINFLQFADKQWDRWAGNKFAWHNRLRTYEFHRLFTEEGVEILSVEESVDGGSIAALEKGFQVDSHFAGRSPKELAVSVLVIAGRFREKHP